MQEMRRNQVESLLFAEEIPVIAEIGIEWGGRIWVERSSAEPGVATTPLPSASTISAVVPAKFTIVGKPANM